MITLNNLKLAQYLLIIRHNQKYSSKIYTLPFATLIKDNEIIFSDYKVYKRKMQETAIQIFSLHESQK